MSEAFDRFALAWERASLAAVRDGLAWYPSARRTVLRVAMGACGPVPFDLHGEAKALAVCAVLSPRLPWARNVSDVHQAFAGQWSAMCALGAGRLKARAILDAWPGDPWEHHVSGRKVTAFYRGLAGDTDAVCLDAHMFRLAGLNPERITDRRYADTAAALVRLSHDVSVPPRDLQAILWCHVRGRAT